MRPYLCSCFLVGIIFLTLGCQKHNSVIPATLSVSPTVDTIGGIISITGSGFSTVPTENLVLFNDSSFGYVISATSTQLTVEVPAYTTEGRITVRTKSGWQAQTAQVFTEVPKFSPASEAVSYPIYIQAGGGTNMADYSVSFNGVTAKPTSMILDQLSVPVPPGANNGKITVYYKGKPYTSFTDFTLTPVGTVTTITSVGAFTLPTGIALDGNGNIFVCDLEGGYIDKEDPVSGAVSAYAGNGTYNFNGGSPLLAAGVYGSTDLAFAPDGSLYTTNTWYGPLIRIYGDSAQSLSQSLPGFSSTVGIYINHSGIIFLTDEKAIKKVSTDGIISVIAGQEWVQGFQNGPAATASFGNPNCLTLDQSGNIYVGDEQLIRLISNGNVSDFSGAGSNGGYVDGTATAGFLGISGIVTDPTTGNMFVADQGSFTVRMVTPTGIVTTIAGSPGQQGHADGIGSAALFQGGPSAITMDKSGNIYVTDGTYGNGAVRKIVLH